MFGILFNKTNAPSPTEDSGGGGGGDKGSEVGGGAVGEGQQHGAPTDTEGTVSSSAKGLASTPAIDGDGPTGAPDGEATGATPMTVVNQHNKQAVSVICLSSTPSHISIHTMLPLSVHSSHIPVFLHTQPSQRNTDSSATFSPPPSAYQDVQGGGGGGASHAMHPPTHSQLFQQRLDFASPDIQLDGTDTGEGLRKRSIMELVRVNRKKLRPNHYPRLLPKPSDTLMLELLTKTHAHTPDLSELLHKFPDLALMLAGEGAYASLPPLWLLSAALVVASSTLPRSTHTYSTKPGEAPARPVSPSCIASLPILYLAIPLWVGLHALIIIIDDFINIDGYINTSPLSLYISSSLSTLMF